MDATRDDFLPTMTEQEGKLLKQHGDWQTNLLQQGLILVHGPVIDPAGSSGVAIWQIGNDADIAAFTAQDPIVRAGVGHYEHFPMMQLNPAAEVSANRHDDHQRTDHGIEASSFR